MYELEIGTGLIDKGRAKFVEKEQVFVGGPRAGCKGLAIFDTRFFLGWFASLSIKHGRYAEIVEDVEEIPIHDRRRVVRSGSFLTPNDVFIRSLVVGQRNVTAGPRLQSKQWLLGVAHIP